MGIVAALRSSRYQRLGKEGLWIVVGQALSMIGMLVGVRVMTELLAPVEYGNLALAMTIALFVNQSVLGPLGQGVTRFYAPAVEKNDVRSYWRASRQLAAWATAYVTLVAALASTTLYLTGHSRWAIMAVAALLLALVLGYNSILNGVQNAARQRKVVALHQGLLTWARFVFAAALIWLFGASSSSAIGGYVMAGMLVLGSQWLGFRKRLEGTSELAAGTEDVWRRQIWQYSWPFATWGLFSWAQLASDRWALELYASTREVGLYSVLFQMGYQPMSVATGLAVQFIAPIVFQRAGDATDARRTDEAGRLTVRLTRLALGVTAVAFLIGWVLHEQIFQLLVAEDFAEVSPLLPWVLLSGGLFAAAQTRSLHIMGLMKPAALLPVKVGTAVLGVSLSFGGAYLYGVPGTVAAGVVFGLVYLIWVSILSFRHGRPSGA
jgi:O-antigen/teichoic acid export membrane protein